MKKSNSRDLKICLVSPSFLPSTGGAELAVHHIAMHLKEIVDKVVVFTQASRFGQKYDLNYEVRFYPKIPKGYLKGYIFALYLILLQKTYKFDLIHIHKAQMGYYAIKLIKLLNIPIIITTHGGDIQIYPEINYGDRLDPFWNKRIEYAVKNADLVTAISTATKKQYLDIGVFDNRIINIPNGVVCERFNDACPDVREMLGLSKDAKLLLTVGNYRRVKGYEYLLKAIPEIINHCKEIKCLMIGKKLEMLKPLIKELHVKDYIILLNQDLFNQAKDDNDKINLNKMPNDILLSAYKSSDIYVSSSLIEGFALTIVEAMAAGLPIVATNVPGNEDAVVDCKNGLLVKPKSSEDLSEKIVKLLRNENGRIAMGENSQEMSKRYDWRIIAEEYVKAYKSLIIN